MATRPTEIRANTSAPTVIDFKTAENNLSQDLLSTMTRNGADLTSFDWIALGLQLGMDETALRDLMHYYSTLEHIVHILTGSCILNVSRYSYLVACLSLWLKKTDGVKENQKATLLSLIRALKAVKETANVAIGIFKEKFLDNQSTIRVRWTTLSITGPPGCGKPSVLLKLLPDTKTMSMETGCLIITRGENTKEWERVDYEALTKMVSNEIKPQKASSISSISPLPAQDVSIQTASEHDDSLFEECVLHFLQREQEEQHTSRAQLNQLMKELDVLEEQLRSLGKRDEVKRGLLKHRRQQVEQQLKDCKSHLHKKKQNLREGLTLVQQLKHDSVVELLERVHFLQIVKKQLTELTTSYASLIKITPQQKTHLHVKRPRSFTLNPQPSLELHSQPSIEIHSHHSLEIHSQFLSKSFPLSQSLSLEVPKVRVRRSSLQSSPKKSHSKRSASFSRRQKHSPNISPSQSLFQINHPNHSAIEDIIDSMSYDSDEIRDLTQVHFIYVVDTGGHSAFLDIAPALLRYNSVNIVTHRLDRELGSYFDNSLKQHQLTHQEVLELSVHSFAFLKPPELNDVSEIARNPERPNFVVLGTGEIIGDEDDTINEKNYQIKSKLTEFSEFILRYGSSLIFPVTDAQQGDKNEKVSKAICRKISKCYMEADIPLRWFLFQLELERLGKVKPVRQVVKKEECVKIGATLEMTSEEVEKALLYFHDLTVIFYFPQALPNIVILDSQILLDKLLKLLDKFKADGMFEENKLEPFFDDSFTASDFLKLMETLLLVAKLSSTYFFPCLLSRVSADELADIRMNVRKELQVDPLILKWDKGPVPQGLFPALVVYFISQQQSEDWECSNTDSPCLHRNAIQLSSVGLSNNILLIDSFYWLEIHFLGDPTECQSLKETVYSGISEVVKAFNYSPQLISTKGPKAPREFFYCSVHVCEAEDHLCVVSENGETVNCCKYGTSYLINYQRQRPWIVGELVTTDSRKERNINDLDVLLVILKEGKFRFRKWARLGYILGIPQSTIDSIDHDSTTKCLRECLTIWRSNERGSPTTWEAVVDALEKIDEQKVANYIRQQL